MLTRFILVMCFGMMLLSCGSGHSSSSESNETERSLDSFDSVVTKGFQLSITDAPVDIALIDKMILDITAISVSCSDDTLNEQCEGWVRLETYDPPMQLDLMALREGTASTFNLDIPPGKYDKLRFRVPRASLILKTGITESLVFPPEKLDLVVEDGFEIIEGEFFELTADFNLRKSLTFQRGRGVFKFSPVVRMVKTRLSGHIDITVDPFSLNTVFVPGGDIPTVDRVVTFVYKNDTYDVSEAQSNYENAINSAVTTTQDATARIAFIEKGAYDLIVVALGVQGDYVTTLGEVSDVASTANLHSTPVIIDLSAL